MSFLEDLVRNFAAIALLVLGMGAIVTGAVAVVLGIGALGLLPLLLVHNDLLAREAPVAVVLLADLSMAILALAVTMTAMQRLLDILRKWDAVSKIERFLAWASNLASY